MATSNVNFKVKNGLDAGGDIAAGGVLKSTNSFPNEGGQIELSLPSSGSTLSGTNVTIDIYQNKLRFFESAGTNRGFYIDISAGGSTVGTNLAAGGSSYTAPTLAGTTLNSGGTINTLSGTLTADQFAASNNGLGTNFKVGDDAWIGDINAANTIRITGIQDATQGYLVFGNSNGTALGRSGTGALTYGGNTVWHSGNDGGSSGLDADLLDGYDTATTNTASTVVVRDASGNFAAGTITATLTGTASKATNIVGGNSTTLLGSIPYQSSTDTTTLLSPNTTSTKKFLRQTGTGTNGDAPAWDTLVDGDIPSALTGKTYNGLTVTSTTGTLTVTNAKTLSVSNTLTLAGTDSTTMTFPSTSATIARTDNAQTFTGVQTFSSMPVISATVASGSTIPTEYYYNINADANHTFTSGTPTSMFPALSNGLALNTNSIYEFDIFAHIAYGVTSGSSVNGTITFDTLFAAPGAYYTRTVYDISYAQAAFVASTIGGAIVYPTIPAPSSALTMSTKFMSTATITTLATAIGPTLTASYSGTTTYSSAIQIVRIRGTLQTSTGTPTLLPQIKFTVTGTGASSSAKILNGSYMKVKKVATTSILSSGSWS